MCELAKLRPRYLVGQISHESGEYVHDFAVLRNNLLYCQVETIVVETHEI